MFETVQNYDCVFMSETWTNESSNVDMHGFISFCKHRKRKKTAKRDSGGLVVYFKEYVVKGVQEIRWNYDDGICPKHKFVFGWERDIYLLYV